MNDAIGYASAPAAFGDRDAEVRPASSRRRRGRGHGIERRGDELAGLVLHGAERNLVLQRVDQLDVADRAGRLA